ncbi:MAG TPA: hypothetical protein VIM16_17510 [Mucilaginibacter sp.]|jgi:hypothetical protein
MSKNDKKSVNNITGKRAANGSKPGNKVETERAKANYADKPEISSPEPGNQNQNISETKHPVPAVKEPKTQNLLPETKMEVHHHPQLEHNPKPFKEYLLEGFMIFIAVMMVDTIYRHIVSEVYKLQTAVGLCLLQ